MKKSFLSLLLVLFSIVALSERVFVMRDWGVVPDTGGDIAGRLNEVLKTIQSEAANQSIRLVFEKGRYDFFEDNATVREYYISNHDQDNPKKVGICLEGWENLVFEGGGAEFVFHASMLPVSLVGSKNCELKNFSIDFKTPHITQVKILSSDGNGMVFEAAEWTNTRINESGLFESYADTWSNVPQTGIAFEGDSRHVVYRTSDLWCPTNGIRQISGRIYHAPNWKDKKLKEGTIVAMRTYYRPAPAIFLAENKSIYLENVKVHYAEGMGLLAQSCEDIFFDVVCV